MLRPSSGVSVGRVEMVEQEQDGCGARDADHADQRQPQVT